jgi:hypothetical protein
VAPKGRVLICAIAAVTTGLQDRLELLELPAHAAAQLIAKLEHAGVADRVARMVALLGAGDHPGRVKDPEVLGDVLL